MNKSEIVSLSDERLLASLYWLSASHTWETEKYGRITHKTIKKEKWVLEELEKRFGVSAEDIRRHIDK